MSNFLSISLQPGYGHGTLALSWNVLPQHSAGTVFIFRSFTGTAPWDVIDDIGVPASVGYFVDHIDALKESKHKEVFYRLSLEVPRASGEPEIINSPILQPLADLTPRERKTAVNILFSELRMMCSGNGMPAFIFAPLRRGIPAAGFDFQTKQMGGTGMRPGKESYGEAFVGGFGPPTVTRFIKLGTLGLNYARTADGYTQEGQSCMARMLAFPRPQPDYLIVAPKTDERFIVGEQITPLLFAGQLPIGYEVPLVALTRTDPRYQIPVPEMPREMYLRP